MATNRWLGFVPAVAQVDTFTIAGTPAAGNTVSITIGGVTLTYTVVTGDTAITIATNFQALLSATTAGMFQDEQWSSTGTTGVITATATTPGKPVSYSTSSTGGGATITAANVTPSSGPSDVSIPANWSTGALPTSSDNLLFDGASAADALYGLASITGSYASLTILASFQGNIGLPFLNTSSSNAYVEYRPRFFPVPSAAPITIGEGTGQGPTRVYLSCGTVLAATIYATGTSNVTNVPTVNIIGNTSGTLSITSGSVGLAADDNTTSSTVTTCSMATGTLTIGAGATVTTLNEDAGTVLAYGTVTTLNANGGTAALYGNPTTITAVGTASITWLGNGTLGTATFNGQGTNDAPTLNCGVDPRARTITNATFYGGAAFLDPNKTVTMSNAFAFDQTSLDNSILGERFTVLRS